VQIHIQQENLGRAWLNEWVLTGPDHEAFEAELVRACGYHGAVSDGLQAYGTVVLVGLDLDLDFRPRHESNIFIVISLW
jgi:hypothetical protein